MCIMLAMVLGPATNYMVGWGPSILYSCGWCGVFAVTGIMIKPEEDQEDPAVNSPDLN